jgi:hypothetical protein
MNNSFIIHIATIAFTLVLCTGILAWTASKYLKNNAVDGCISASAYQGEFTNGTEKTTSTTPIDEWYLLCMNDKGYQTTVNVQQ